MRWESGRRSSNIEDRRGMGGGTLIGGGGIGMVILVLIISFVTGTNPLELMQQVDTGAPAGGPVEPGTPEAISEADVEGEPGADALGRQVEEPRHFLAAHVAAGRLVDLDELGAGRDEPLQLLVDDLGEALRDLDDALVGPAWVYA